MVKQISFCGNMAVYTPPKKVNGVKEYFKDDYFGTIELIKENEVVLIDSYAKCIDYEQMGYKNLHSLTRLRIPFANLINFLAGILLQIYYLKYFRSNKSE